MGVELPRFVSVSLCLIRDGHQVVCIPGYGPTREHALDNVVRKANSWIARDLLDTSKPPSPPKKRIDNRYRRRSDMQSSDTE
jgi:hypothetical protein